MRGVFVIDGALHVLNTDEIARGKRNAVECPVQVRLFALRYVYAVRFFSEYRHGISLNMTYDGDLHVKLQIPKIEHALDLFVEALGRVRCCLVQKSQSVLRGLQCFAFLVNICYVMADEI